MEKTSSDIVPSKVMKIIKTISELDKSDNYELTKEYYNQNGTFEGIEEYLECCSKRS